MGQRSEDAPRGEHEDATPRGRFFSGATRRHETQRGRRQADEGERMDYGRSPWWGGHERRPLRRRPSDHQHEGRAAAIEREPYGDAAPDVPPPSRPPRWDDEGFEQRRFRTSRPSPERYDDDLVAGRPFPEDFRAGREPIGRAPRARWQREPLTAGEIMTRDPKTVTPESALAEVAAVMKGENCGIVPVVDAERRLQGVVTDRDIVIRALAEGQSPMTAVARDVMTDDVEGVTVDDTVLDVIELMGRSQVRRVPVVDQEDRLLGIIAMADVANRADYDEDLQDALEHISSRRSFWTRLWS